MRLTNKTERWQQGITYVGKKKNCKVTISYVPKNHMNKETYWYFLITNDEKDIQYNSLWNSLKYKTIEDCVAACEKKVDELVKTKKEK